MTTDEELNDINTYILLPMILGMIDRWMSYPDITPLKHLHSSQFQQLLDMITLDHVEVKQKLKAADIKVVEDWKIGSSLDYKIFARRKEESFMIWKGWAKSQIETLLGQYVGKLDKRLFKRQADVVVEDKPIDRSLFVNFD
ncbi:hypothetical protein LOZ80_25890 [Paenibacillus sp. HWE-109]|uniref:hypothetical protein n=1 Tax=Paenibacillus sp. HWE-109 TaxID=1306526 RepID=UPI001EDE1A30|nr:hypothetical protein [Paenibacillus sp. HWE-109]UKS25012.1 hypothetical protein LOZ80_25890 [Paenibacillus sp. HWE-109]